jgi:aminoglycoside phosphotransferase (APT) family kinase protein
MAGPGATVTAVERLVGGTHALTYLITMSPPEMEVVLREFPAGDEAARHEVRVLDALEGLGGLAPRLLASDVDDDRPWTLVSRLPGGADISPVDPDDFARHLGRALARIHGTDVERVRGFPSVFDRRGGSVADLGGPAGSWVAGRWEQVVAGSPSLTHDDFWSGNVVWEDGRLSGVVDWCSAALGPAGFDLGWCRLDLCLLYDRRIADVFLRSYEITSRSSVADVGLWDLWAVARSHEAVETWVTNYRELGRTELTGAELRRRHTRWTAELLGET